MSCDAVEVRSERPTRGIEALGAVQQLDECIMHDVFCSMERRDHRKGEAQQPGAVTLIQLAGGGCLAAAELLHQSEVILRREAHAVRSRCAIRMPYIAIEREESSPDTLWLIDNVTACQALPGKY